MECKCAYCGIELPLAQQPDHLPQERTGLLHSDDQITLLGFALHARLLCFHCLTWLEGIPGTRVNARGDKIQCFGHYMVTHAAAFASHAHRHQRRKNLEGQPYISHPLNVAALLSRSGVYDPTILAAAYLHDTLEDCDVSAKDIEKEFGICVAAIVLQVTDDKSLPKAEQKRGQLARAATFSYGARLVKLADICDNLSSFKNGWPVGWTRERVQGYFALKRAVVRTMVDRAPAVVPELLCDTLNTLWSLQLTDPAHPDQGTFPALPDDEQATLEAYLATL